MSLVFGGASGQGAGIQLEVRVLCSHGTLPVYSPLGVLRCTLPGLWCALQGGLLQTACLLLPYWLPVRTHREKEAMGRRSWRCFFLLTPHLWPVPRGLLHIPSSHRAVGTLSPLLLSARGHSPRYLTILVGSLAPALPFVSSPFHKAHSRASLFPSGRCQVCPPSLVTIAPGHCRPPMHSAASEEQSVILCACVFVEGECWQAAEDVSLLGWYTSHCRLTHWHSERHQGLLMSCFSKSQFLEINPLSKSN